MATPVINTHFQDSTYLNFDYYNDSDSANLAEAKIDFNASILESNRRYMINLVRAQVPLQLLPMRTNKDSPAVITIRQSSTQISRVVDMTAVGAYTVKDCVEYMNAAIQAIFVSGFGGAKAAYPHFRVVDNGLEFYVPKFSGYDATHPDFFQFQYFGNFECFSQYFMGHFVRFDPTETNPNLAHRMLLYPEKTDAVVTLPHYTLTTTQDWFVFRPDQDSTPNMKANDTLIIQCTVSMREEFSGQFDNQGSSESIQMLTDFSLLQVQPGENVVILPAKDRLINLYSSPFTSVTLKVLYRNKSGQISKLLLGPHTHLSCKLEIREVS